MQTVMFTIAGYTATKLLDKWYLFHEGKTLEFQSFAAFVAWTSGKPKMPLLAHIRSNN